MRNINKILLVVDSWMLQFGAVAVLGGLRLEGIHVIYYHVADYGEAIASSPDQYSEAILPGAGITSLDQFIVERTRKVTTFLRHRNQSSVPGNAEVEVHPRPLVKILEKAKAEGVDLVILGVPFQGLNPICKGALAENIVQESNCLVLTVPVNTGSKRVTAFEQTQDYGSSF